MPYFNVDMITCRHKRFGQIKNAINKIADLKAILFEIYSRRSFVGEKQELRFFHFDF